MSIVLRSYNISLDLSKGSLHYFYYFDAHGLNMLTFSTIWWKRNFDSMIIRIYYIKKQNLRKLYRVTAIVWPSICFSRQREQTFLLNFLLHWSQIAGWLEKVPWFIQKMPLFAAAPVLCFLSLSLCCWRMGFGCSDARAA